MASKDERITAIAKHYGYEPQAHQLVEEMAELTQALNKFWRIRKKNEGQAVNPVDMKLHEAADHIAEEIADVSICLEQVTQLLGVEFGVSKYREEKINRQLHRIAAEGKE